MSEFFYNPVESAVRDELRRREGQIAKANRTSTHVWTHGKSAWALISTINRTFTIQDNIQSVSNEFKTSRDILTLGVPGSRGFLTQYAHQSNSRYKSVNFVPLDVIKSIKMDEAISQGTLYRASVEFAVFTKNDFDRIEERFLLPGRYVRIQYGWSTYSSPGNVQVPNSGEIIGVVYNYSFEVRPDGGYDCKFDMISPGMFMLDLKMLVKGINDGSVNPETQTKALNIFDYLSAQVPERDRKRFTILNRESDSYYYITHKVQPNEESGEDAESNSMESEIYYSLGMLVDTLNDKIFPEVFENSEFKITIAGNSLYTEGLLSTDPKNILILVRNNGAAEAEYSTDDGGLKWKVTGDVDAAAFDATDGGRPGAILISETFLKRFVETEFSRITVKSFFQNLFGKIRTATAGMIHLQLVRSLDSATEFFIVDKNYGNVVEQVGPTIIQTFNQRSVARDLKVVGKVPSELASATFVGASATGGNQFLQNISIYGLMGQKVTTEPETELLNDLKEARKSAIDNKFDHASVATYSTAMGRYLSKRLSAELESGSKQLKPLYPLEMQVTLDGISGFRFGDIFTVSGDALPSRYVYSSTPGPKVVFMVVGIQHEIINNDWSTTLIGQCRLTNG